MQAVVGKWTLTLTAGEIVNDVTLGKTTWQKLLRFKIHVLPDCIVLLLEACKRQDQSIRLFIEAPRQKHLNVHQQGDG